MRVTIDRYSCRSTLNFKDNCKLFEDVKLHYTYNNILFNINGA